MAVRYLTGSDMILKEFEAEFHPQTAEPVLTSPYVSMEPHSPKSGGLPMSCGGVFNNDPVIMKSEELSPEVRVVFKFQADRSTHEIEVCRSIGCNHSFLREIPCFGSRDPLGTHWRVFIKDFLLNLGILELLALVIVLCRWVKSAPWCSWNP